MATYTVPYNNSPATSPTPTPERNADAGVNRGGPNWASAPSSSGSSGGTPPVSQNWGSFGTYGNWQNAFASAHGRMPDVQDEADYVDSQIFAAINGRAPNWNEWRNRYFGGDWDASWNGVTNERGQFVPIPPNGRDTRSGGFFDALANPQALPEAVRGMVEQWQDGLVNRSGVPEWLQQNVSAARDVRGVTQPTDTTTQSAAPPTTAATQTEAPPPVIGQAPQQVQTPTINTGQFYDVESNPGFGFLKRWLNPQTQQQPYSGGAGTGWAQDIAPMANTIGNTWNTITSAFKPAPQSPGGGGGFGGDAPSSQPHATKQIWVQQPNWLEPGTATIRR